jgi:hypothetical protein
LYHRRIHPRGIAVTDDIIHAVIEAVAAAAGKGARDYRPLELALRKEFGGRKYYVRKNEPKAAPGAPESPRRDAKPPGDTVDTMLFDRFAIRSHAIAMPPQFRPNVDRPGGCYACRYFGERRDAAVWCANPGHEHVRSQAERGCAFWEREPGADA